MSKSKYRIQYTRNKDRYDLEIGIVSLAYGDPYVTWKFLAGGFHTIGEAEKYARDHAKMVQDMTPTTVKELEI